MSSRININALKKVKSEKILPIFKLYFSHPFCKKGLRLLQKHSWPASKMAANLSFQFTYSSMVHTGQTEKFA
jgi:hypothetical protein